MINDELMAKYIAYSVRNALEDLHLGVTPSSQTGDYSDVYVISPYGRIEWNRVSRISDKEMRVLMLAIHKKILDSLKVIQIAQANFTEEVMIDFLEKLSLSWDLPNR